MRSQLIRLPLRRMTIVPSDESPLFISVSNLCRHRAGSCQNQAAIGWPSYLRQHRAYPHCEGIMMHLIITLACVVIAIAPIVAAVIYEEYR